MTNADEQIDWAKRRLLILPIVLVIVFMIASLIPLVKFYIDYNHKTEPIQDKP